MTPHQSIDGRKPAWQARPKAVHSLLCMIGYTPTALILVIEELLRSELAALEKRRIEERRPPERVAGFFAKPDGAES